MIATLTIGIIIGALAGFTFACVLTAAKQADEGMQPLQEPTKPAKLLTVGGVVTWLGETFVIERFAVGEDNQTDAIIKNDRAMLCVPVVDLEAVEE